MCEQLQTVPSAFDDKRRPSTDNSSSTGNQSFSIWRCCYSWWDPRRQHVQAMRTWGWYSFQHSIGCTVFCWHLYNSMIQTDRGDFKWKYLLGVTAKKFSLMRLCSFDAMSPFGIQHMCFIDCALFLAETRVIGLPEQHL